MSGVQIQIDDSELLKMIGRLDSFADGLIDEVGYSMAGLGESQTRRRLAEEKTAPDGEPWAPWSPGYARTRRRGQSLLQAGGDLIDSIASDYAGGEAYWGSNLVYAAIHQAGGDSSMAPGPAGIPERPYLGISDENREEIYETLQPLFEERLQ